MTLVHWLGESPGAADAQTVGGKAASVAQLMRRGLPAPEGFVVAAGAFSAYLDAAGAAEVARQLVDGLPDPAAEAQLEALVHGHPLPGGLAADLDAAVVRIAAGGAGRRLAVRSSGRSEDSRATSFAGQHETFLGIEPAEVESALRRCWVSLWSPRAIAYRRSQGLAPAEPDEMAVLVQPLVEAVASAIVFTVNPVSGDREEVVVEAARGLGQQIVSGGVTADSIVLDRITLAPRGIGSRGAEHAPANGHGKLAVPVDSAAELSELCLRAERCFRFPLDVEAAHDGERWWLLQARPITANGGAR